MKFFTHFFLSVWLVFSLNFYTSAQSPSTTSSSVGNSSQSKNTTDSNLSNDDFVIIPNSKTETNNINEKIQNI
jgi:hypothetical protein